MDQFNLTMAQQLAQAASTFHQRRTGHIPKSATVILTENRLVIALHGGLSPATTALTRSPAGAVQMQESLRQLFPSSSGSLREEVNRITGVEVCAASGEIETTPPAVKPMFAGWYCDPGVPACQQCPRGHLERELHKRVVMRTEVSHVGLVKETPASGCGRRVRSLRASAQNHGARD